MNKGYFSTKMRDIYAIFGKTWPNDVILDAIYSQIASYPDSFMDFAVKRMQDEEKMPVNFGRFMRFDLWPDFLAENRQLQARHDQAGCARCKHDLPGYKCYWEKDGTPHICRCTCNMDERTAGLWTPTDMELRDLGLLTENPIPFFGPQEMTCAMRNAVGNDEKPRERHVEYLQSQESTW